MANDNPDSGVTPETGAAPGESGVAVAGNDQPESPGVKAEPAAERTWPVSTGPAPSPWAPPGQWAPPAYGRHEDSRAGAGENDEAVPDLRWPTDAARPGADGNGAATDVRWPAGHPGGFPPSDTRTFGPGVGGPPASRGRGIAGVTAVALVAAVLGGGVGGAVGHALADRGGGITGVLGRSLPEIDAAAAPLGPVEAVAARVLPSVVQLRVETPTGGGEGSGMVLSADGLMLTNNHVVEEAAVGGTVTVMFQNGATAPVQVIGRDPTSDIAVLRAQNVSGLTPIELGNSDSVRVGQQVVAFGSPLGLGGTVTTGIISAVDRAVTVGPESGVNASTVLNALQTDAAINPGNSGGPLVDMQGRVVGINSAIATRGGQGGSIGVGFSIPINQAHRVAEELERTGRASRAVLGVNVNVGPQRQTNGAVVGQVVPGGPAELAGLRVGQVISRVDDRIIVDGNELVAAIRDHPPGSQVILVVDGREVVVTLGSETN
ncbi:MAG: trypsin-like peptidase domain-containing protein [Pseudonocardia sp.]